MQLNKQILNEIGRQINGDSFHKTELYKVLRDELSGIGNWKAKPRGKPDANNFAGKGSGVLGMIPTNTINYD